MSSKDKKKDKKKESEKFDGNIDLDSVEGSTTSSTRGNNSGGAGSSGSSSYSQPKTSSDKNTGTGDMSQLCKILQDGFTDVSSKITTKLNDVSDNFSKSLEGLQKKMDEVHDFDSRRDFEHDSSRSGSNWDDGVSDISSVRHRSSVTSETSVGKESYFKQLNKPKAEEKLGKPVDADLAEAVDRFFRRPVSELEFKEYKTKYARPENVLWTQTPEISRNIWTRLPQEFRNADKPMHFVQEQLGPVTSSLIYAMEQLGEGNLEGGRDILSDSMAMLGYVFRTNMTEKRRSSLKTKLPDDFKMLASDKCEPSPTNLLGDISENSKKISETEKITTQMDRAKNQGKKPTTRGGRGNFKSDRGQKRSHSNSNSD